MAAEDTQELTVADRKLKGGFKTENNDHINLKVARQDGSLLQCKIRNIYHLVN